MILLLEEMNANDGLLEQTRLFSGGTCNRRVRSEMLCVEKLGALPGALSFRGDQMQHTANAMEEEGRRCVIEGRRKHEKKR